MKKLLGFVSSTVTINKRWVKRVSLCIVIETEFAVEVNGHQKISVLFLTVNRVFDRRAMESDRPSQEGREYVPSESSFLVSAPVADPTPVVTRSSEGSPRTDLVHGH